MLRGADGEERVRSVRRGSGFLLWRSVQLNDLMHTINPCTVVFVFNKKCTDKRFAGEAVSDVTSRLHTSSWDSEIGVHWIFVRS